MVIEPMIEMMMEGREKCDHWLSNKLQSLHVM